MARKLALPSLFLVICLGFSLGDGTYQAEASDDICAKELDEDTFNEVIDSSKFALVVRDPTFCIFHRTSGVLGPCLHWSAGTHSTLVWTLSGETALPPLIHNSVSACRLHDAPVLACCCRG